MSSLLADMMREGNHSEVRRIIAQIDQYPDTLNARDEQGFTALHYAALRGNEEITFRLLEASTDIHVKTETAQRTALHMAALGKNKKIMQKIIELGANIHAKDIYNDTPLQISNRFLKKK